MNAKNLIEMAGYYSMSPDRPTLLNFKKEQVFSALGGVISNVENKVLFPDGRSAGYGDEYDPTEHRDPRTILMVEITAVFRTETKVFVELEDPAKRKKSLTYINDLDTFDEIQERLAPKIYAWFKQKIQALPKDQVQIRRIHHQNPEIIQVDSFDDLFDLVYGTSLHRFRFHIHGPNTEVDRRAFELAAGKRPEDTTYEFFSERCSYDCVFVVISPHEQPAFQRLLKDIAKLQAKRSLVAPMKSKIAIDEMACYWYNNKDEVRDDFDENEHRYHVYGGFIRYLEEFVVKDGDRVPWYHYRASVPSSPDFIKKDPVTLEVELTARFRLEQKVFVARDSTKNHQDSSGRTFGYLKDKVFAQAYVWFDQKIKELPEESRKFVEYVDHKPSLITISGLEDTLDVIYGTSLHRLRFGMLNPENMFGNKSREAQRHAFELHAGKKPGDTVYIITVRGRYSREDELIVLVSPEEKERFNQVLKEIERLKAKKSLA